VTVTIPSTKTGPLVSVTNGVASPTTDPTGATPTVAQLDNLELNLNACGVTLGSLDVTDFDIDANACSFSGSMNSSTNWNWETNACNMNLTLNLTGQATVSCNASSFTLTLGAGPLAVDSDGWASSLTINGQEYDGDYHSTPAAAGGAALSFSGSTSNMTITQQGYPIM
jgi:hypothetical protein